MQSVRALCLMAYLGVVQNAKALAGSVVWMCSSIDRSGMTNRPSLVNMLPPDLSQ